MLMYDKAAYSKWEARYSWCLRQAIRNGVAYLSPMLVGNFKDYNINVIFTEGGLAEMKDNRYLKVSYQEPGIDVMTGLPIDPVIFISEEDRSANRFHKNLAL